jgi:hypothetical protein
VRMTRIEVPEEHERGHIAFAGTEPNENETRVGAPRVADIRGSDRHPSDVAVRRDDDGTPYVGVPERYGEKVMDFFADEYGVKYNDDGEITGQATDEPEPSEPEGESETPDTSDRPAEPDATADAHWNAVVAAIESGAYDDSLGTVEDNDDRESVQNAISDRREVLDE